MLLASISRLRAHVGWAVTSAAPRVARGTLPKVRARASVRTLSEVRFERHVFAFGWSPARPDDAINLPCLSNRPTTRDVTRARPLCEHA